MDNDLYSVVKSACVDRLKKDGQFSPACFAFKDGTILVSIVIPYQNDREQEVMLTSVGSLCAKHGVDYIVVVVNSLVKNMDGGEAIDVKEALIFYCIDFKKTVEMLNAGIWVYEKNNDRIVFIEEQRIEKLEECRIFNYIANGMFVAENRQN